MQYHAIHSIWKTPKMHQSFSLEPCAFQVMVPARWSRVCDPSRCNAPRKATGWKFDEVRCAVLIWDFSPLENAWKLERKTMENKTNDKHCFPQQLQKWPFAVACGTEGTDSKWNDLITIALRAKHRSKVLRMLECQRFETVLWNVLHKKIGMYVDLHPPWASQRPVCQPCWPKTKTWLKFVHAQCVKRNASKETSYDQYLVAWQTGSTSFGSQLCFGASPLVAEATCESSAP